VNQPVVEQNKAEHLVFEWALGALEGRVGAKIHLSAEFVIEVFGGAVFIQVRLPLEHFTVAKLAGVVGAH